MNVNLYSLISAIPTCNLCIFTQANRSLIVWAQNFTVWSIYLFFACTLLMVWDLASAINIDSTTVVVVSATPMAVFYPIMYRFNTAARAAAHSGSERPNSIPRIEPAHKPFGRDEALMRFSRLSHGLKPHHCHSARQPAVWEWGRAEWGGRLQVDGGRRARKP